MHHLEDEHHQAHTIFTLTLSFDVLVGCVNQFHHISPIQEQQNPKSNFGQKKHTESSSIIFPNRYNMWLLKQTIIHFSPPL
jgi:hypothetical protein